jgi:hypothetical protein
MKKWIATAAVISIATFGSTAFAASGSSGLDASSSPSNNQVGSSPAGGGSMINPGGYEHPKNSDVLPKPGVTGTSRTIRSEAGRNPMQDSTLGSASTAPRGDSR